MVYKHFKKFQQTIILIAGVWMEFESTANIQNVGFDEKTDSLIIFHIDI